MNSDRKSEERAKGIRIRCTACGATLQIGAAYYGKRVTITCPSCGKGRSVSLPAQPAVASSAPEMPENTAPASPEPEIDLSGVDLSSLLPDEDGSQKAPPSSRPADRSRAQAPTRILPAPFPAVPSQPPTQEKATPPPPPPPPQLETDLGEFDLAWLADDEDGSQQTGASSRVSDSPAKRLTARLEAELREIEKSIPMLRRSVHQIGGSSKAADDEANVLAARADPYSGSNVNEGGRLVGWFFFGLAGYVVVSLLQGMSGGGAGKSVSRIKADAARSEARSLRKGRLSLCRELAQLKRRRFVLRRIATGRVPRMINFIGIPVLCAMFLLSLLIVAMVAGFVHKLVGLGVLIFAAFLVLWLWRRMFVPVAEVMPEYPIWRKPLYTLAGAAAYPWICASAFLICLLPAGVVVTRALAAIIALSREDG